MVSKTDGLLLDMAETLYNDLLVSFSRKTLQRRTDCHLPADPIQSFASFSLITVSTSVKSVVTWYDLKLREIAGHGRTRVGTARISETHPDGVP